MQRSFLGSMVDVSESSSFWYVGLFLTQAERQSRALGAKSLRPSRQGYLRNGSSELEIVPGKGATRYVHTALGRGQG